MATTLDEVDWRLLRELHRDSRLTIAELGRRASLSKPATRHVCDASKRPA